MKKKSTHEPVIIGLPVGNQLRGQDKSRHVGDMETARELINIQRETIQRLGQELSDEKQVSQRWRNHAQEIGERADEVNKENNALKEKLARLKEVLES